MVFPSEGDQADANELIGVFKEVAAMDLSEEEWAGRESSDMFQSAHFCGGFDAIEGRFLFSYFPSHGGEFWFELDFATLNDAVRTSRMPELHLQPQQP